MDRAELARDFIVRVPFSVALGMRVVSITPGRAVIEMPWADHLVGDPRTGILHGGAVSALMDTCGGAAVISHPEGTGPTATIDLRIDYMRAARPGAPIRAEAVCHHVTRSVAFVRATATDGTSDVPVATVTGAFTFARRAEPEA